jgi:2-polyprenyl-3-methyl-5-hydroxy-6-metoxy-1,4-benzoquinol methylase
MKPVLKTRFGSAALIYDIEIDELIQHALAFEQELLRVKREAAPAGFDWYPYDSFGTLSALDGLLTGRERFARTLIGKEPVLDLGCADGSLAFVFESLGARVHAVDHPPTNYNGMRGVKALKKALRSSVRVQALDLDSHFTLDFTMPAGRFGLTLFFGILYHLKNPFGVLETLAARTRYCLLSTAITRFLPDQKTDLRDVPLAYLAGRDGLKGDETNYWIFSEAGLRALVDRTGWEVRDWMVTGDPEATLWGAQRDERVFCLLQSRAFEPVRRSQLLTGWHSLENNAWRWTKRRFSVAAASSGTLTLKCIVPASLRPPIRLAGPGRVIEFPAPGDYQADFSVDAGVIEFEVDPCLSPDSTDGRERGIIVRAVELSA